VVDERLEHERLPEGVDARVAQSVSSSTMRTVRVAVRALRVVVTVLIGPSHQ
jgi:hypothetical protein